MDSSLVRQPCVSPVQRSPRPANRAASAAYIGPRAPVSREAELDFRERNAFWIDDWARRGSIAAGSLPT